MQLWRLFRIWAVRTFLGRVRSRMGLYTMLLEGPVLALLISLTLRASSSPEYTFATALHIPSYLFLATIVAMFFGLTGAASEVLKDRALLKRESNAKVFVTGYVLAKALVLTGLSAVQSALFLWVGNAILEIHEMFLIYLGTMTLTAFIGVSLSLLVSVFAKTERAALNMVPLLLIPQILMAGAIVHFDEMNQFIPWSAHRTDEHGASSRAACRWWRNSAPCATPLKRWWWTKPPKTYGKGSVKPFRRKWTSSRSSPNWTTENLRNSSCSRWRSCT